VRCLCCKASLRGKCENGGVEKFRTKEPLIRHNVKLCLVQQSTVKSCIKCLIGGLEIVFSKKDM